MAERPASTGDSPTSDELRQRLHRLRTANAHALKRLLGKREKQQAELEVAGHWLEFRHIGDTLLANASRLKRGATECSLADVHTGTAETIKLNPALNPVENAELYFRKAKKSRRGLEKIRENLDETIRELAVCELVRTGLEEIAEAAPEEAVARIDDLERSLTGIGALPRPSVAKGPDRGPAIPYRRFTIDGWEIFVGKNDRQNDELSTRFARPWDVWLHVAGHAGSHVVIRMPKGSEWPPKKLLETVAAFAVWFSKAKHTSFAEVHVTERRFVRKRHGAPPGEVIAERCKTIRVAPLSPQVYFKNNESEENDQWE